jgi:hypothetical protein
MPDIDESVCAAADREVLESTHSAMVGEALTELYTKEQKKSPLELHQVIRSKFYAPK